MLKLNHAANSRIALDDLFVDLHGGSRTWALTLKHAALKECRLRVYGIRIDTNLFVVTGGAIKMGATIQDHADTLKAYEDVKACLHYLKSKGVTNGTSFCELIP